VETSELQAEREKGKRRASLHDFHSFRVTWITLALAAGVPLELVQRVTGHRTVAVVLKHYFRPGREDFRQTILKAMPRKLGQPQR
jgi:integrase